MIYSHEMGITGFEKRDPGLSDATLSELMKTPKHKPRVRETRPWVRYATLSESMKFQKPQTPNPKPSVLPTNLFEHISH